MSNIAYKPHQNNYPKAAPFMPVQGAGQQQAQQQQQGAQPPTGGQYSNPQQQQRGPNPPNIYSNAPQQQQAPAQSANTSNASNASSSSSSSANNNTNPSGAQQQASRGNSGPGGPPQSAQTQQQQGANVSQQSQAPQPSQQQTQIAYMTGPPPPFSHPEQMYQYGGQQIRAMHMMHPTQQILNQQQAAVAAAAAGQIPGYLAYPFQLPPGAHANPGGPAGAAFHPHPGMPGQPAHHMSVYDPQGQFPPNMVGMYHQQQPGAPHGAAQAFYSHQMSLPFIPVQPYYNMQQQQQQQQQQQRDQAPSVSNRDASQTGPAPGATSSLLQQVPGQQATYQINTGQQPLIASAAPYPQAGPNPAAVAGGNPLLSTLPPNFQPQAGQAQSTAHLAMMGGQVNAPNQTGSGPRETTQAQATQAAFLPPSIAQNPAYHQTVTTGATPQPTPALSGQPGAPHHAPTGATQIAPIIPAGPTPASLITLVPQPQPTLTKRVKNPLAIIDPATKKPLVLAPASSTSTTTAENSTPTATSASSSTTSTTPAVVATTTATSTPSNISNKPSQTVTSTTNSSSQKPSTTESSNTSQTEKSQLPSDTKGQVAGSSTLPQQNDLQAQVLRNIREQNKTTNTSTTSTTVPPTTTTTNTSNTPATTAPSSENKPAETTVPVVPSSATTQPTPVSTVPKPISFASIAASQPVPSAAVPKTAIATQAPPKTAVTSVSNKSAESTRPDSKQSTAPLVKEDRQAQRSGAAQNAAQNNKQNAQKETVTVEAPKEPVVSIPPANGAITTVKSEVKPTPLVQESVKPATVVPVASVTVTEEPATVVHSQKPQELVSQKPAPVESKTLQTTSQPQQQQQAEQKPTPASSTTTSQAPPPFWTPENKDGRKQYDRDFLLSLRDKKLSKVMPEALKTMEILATNQPKYPQQGMGGGYHSIGKGSYGGSSSYQHHIGGMGGGSASMGGPDMPGGGHYGATKSDSMKKYGPKHMMKGSRGSMDTRYPPHQVEINLNKDLPLKRTENPYVIKKMTDKQISEHEELIREVRNILNKLTPQNLTKLTGDLINLPINTEDRLKDSIDVIFEKSIDEQVFSQTYAQLCNVLAVIKVQQNNDTSKVINFRTMLLTRCQREFDTDYLASINHDELQEEINNCTDENKKRELKEILQEKANKAKRRSLGNIRFIGELFKLSMLTEGIMNDCIDRLLKQDNDEENLECLCKLLATIGKNMDKPSNSGKMKNYFDRLDRISKKKDTVSARIRFMILDIIDLRKNNWVPRRKDNNPRRIEEIRKEAEEEQQRLEAELAKQQLQGQYNKGSQQGQKGGQKYQQHQGQQGMSGGSLSKSSSMDADAYRAKMQNGSVAINKIKDIKTNINKNINNNDLVLGPGGSSFNSFNAWNKSKTSTTTGAASSTSSSTSNVDSSLTQSSSTTALTSGTSGSGIPSSQSFVSSKPYSAAAASSKSSTGAISDMSKTIKKTDSLSSTGSTSASNSRDTSRASSASRGGQTAPLSPKQKSSVAKRDYTEDEIERKANLLIEEYIQNNDLTDALKDIEEFQPNDADQVRLFIEKVIFVVLERNESSRQACGTLIYQALKHEKFDELMVIGALKGALDVAEDLAIDVPKINVYLSQIVAPLISEDLSNPIKLIHDACEDIMSKNLCGEIICEALHSAANRIGQSAVCGLFRRSRLTLRDFLVSYESQSAQDELIQKKNVEWALNTSSDRERTESASSNATSSVSSSLDAYEKKLADIFGNPATPNEKLFVSIEKEFDSEALNSKLFIRALAIQLIKSCYSDKLDTTEFQKRKDILIKYINKREDIELEVLYAIQALDHRLQHPAGLIRLLFDILYDEDIIPEDVFYRWSNEEREEGHSIAVLATKSFFDWLSEPDAPDTA